MRTRDAAVVKSVKQSPGHLYHLV